MLHNITYTEVLNFFLKGFFFFKFYCFSIESNALLILHFFTDQFLWSSICLQYRFQFRVHFSLWLAPQCDCFLFEGESLWYRFYLSWFWCWYPVFLFLELQSAIDSIEPFRRGIDHWWCHWFCFLILLSSHILKY